jgi:hypothetical protein
MSTASAQIQAYYTVTGRDGTNVTLTKETTPAGRPGDVVLPATLTVAHGGDSTFWGTATDGKRYSLGVDLAG